MFQLTTRMDRGGNNSHRRGAKLPVRTSFMFQRISVTCRLVRTGSREAEAAGAFGALSKYSMVTSVLPKIRTSVIERSQTGQQNSSCHSYLSATGSSLIQPASSLSG